MIDNKYIKEGERLRKIRKILGISAEQIAEDMGVVPNSYRQVEQGKAGFSMNLIKVLAKNYDVNINWLLLERGPMFIKEIEEKEKGDNIHIFGSQNDDPITIEQLHKMVLELQKRVEKT